MAHPGCISVLRLRSTLPVEGSKLTFSCVFRRVLALRMQKIAGKCTFPPFSPLQQPSNARIIRLTEELKNIFIQFCLNCASSFGTPSPGAARFSLRIDLTT
jgi:hypothetical protein